MSNADPAPPAAGSPASESRPTGTSSGPAGTSPGPVGASPGPAGPSPGQTGATPALATGDAAPVPGQEDLARRRGEQLRALEANLANDTGASQDELAQANKRLKNNFVVTLRVFSNLLETRRKHLVGHARRVADLARKLATRLQLEPALVHEVLIAGLLHDLGKLAFPDALLDTPVANMTPNQLDAYRQHPARAEQLLAPLPDLRGAAASIAAQLERFDGTGHPRQLQGRAILVGARILAVCADYDNLQIGMLGPRWLTARQALGVIERAAGTRYDPWVVDAFSAMLRGRPDSAAQDVPQADSAVTDNAGKPATPADLLDDLLVGVSDLDPGDVLSRDLVTPAGLMMLPAGYTIDDRLIRKMADFEQTDKVELAVYIRKPTGDDGAGSDEDKRSADSEGARIGDAYGEDRADRSSHASRADGDGTGGGSSGPRVP